MEIKGNDHSELARRIREAKREKWRREQELRRSGSDEQERGKQRGRNTQGD
jgi:hypothetical protein